MGKFNEWARPHFSAFTCAVSTPFAAAVQVTLYLAWWGSGLAQDALMIALSLEAIMTGLIIIDKQNVESARDHDWQKRVYTELLDKLPKAAPEIADSD